MAKAAPETILLMGEPNRKERDAGATITPGMLLAYNSSDAFIVHASADERVGSKLFAVENDIAGDDITHAYLTGEVVQAHSARSGDEIFARLATANTVVIGDFLTSNGDGDLKLAPVSAATVFAGVYVGIALEARSTIGNLKIEVI